jgi:uncharacterized protein YrzB (UPF0473 family)
MTEHKCKHGHCSEDSSGCGSGPKHEHSHDQDFEEFDTVVLTDEDGQDHEFLHIETLDVDGSTYFVLLPISEDVEETEFSEDIEEAIILKLGKDEEGNDMLLDIEDDEEWEKVADYWEEME